MAIWINFPFYLTVLKIITVIIKLPIELESNGSVQNEAG